MESALDLYVIPLNPFMKHVKRKCSQSLHPSFESGRGADFPCCDPGRSDLLQSITVSAGLKYVTQVRPATFPSQRNNSCGSQTSPAGLG